MDHAFIRTFGYHLLLLFILFINCICGRGGRGLTVYLNHVKSAIFILVCYILSKQTRDIY